MTTRTQQELMAFVWLLVIAMAVASVVDADWPHQLAAAYHALGVREASLSPDLGAP